MYFRSGLFGEQVGRYLEHWPRARFYATTLYDYLADPDHVLDEIQQFLGVEQLQLGPTPLSASSKGTRSIPVQYLERRLLRPLERRRFPLVRQARSKLISWNRQAAKPTMHASTRDGLMHRYRQDLAVLTSHLGIDIERRRTDGPERKSVNISVSKESGMPE